MPIFDNICSSLPIFVFLFFLNSVVFLFDSSFEGESASLRPEENFKIIPFKWSDLVRICDEILYLFIFFFPFLFKTSVIFVRHLDTVLHLKEGILVGTSPQV